MTNSASTAAIGERNFGTAVVIYALYFVSYFTGGFLALVGVIVAHMKADEADPTVRSHYIYQMRTFWYGLVMLIIGVPLAFVGIGIPILVWCFVWTLIRCIKGFLAAQEKRAIPKPATLLW